MIADHPCDGLRLTPIPKVATLLHLPRASLRIYFHHDDLLPARISFEDGGQVAVQVDIENARLGDALPPDAWQLHPAPGEKVQTVPLAHLARFLSTAPGVFLDKAPVLGPATGERKVIATEGKGRLEMIDGTRVLFLQGSPQEMGHQHGVLLKTEINQVVDRILYGVGVASSFERGSWFFGDIESAEARLQPFMDARYLAEMDALAVAMRPASRGGSAGQFFP